MTAPVHRSPSDGPESVLDEGMITTICAALPALEKVAGLDRFARKALDSIYQAVGREPPYRVARDQRTHARRERQRQREHLLAS